MFCTFWVPHVLRATTACTFSTSQLLKVLRSWGVLCILTSKSASRHNGVQFFISHLARWLRTRGFSKPYFSTRRSHKSVEKRSVSRLFYLFARTATSFFWLFLLTLSSDFFFWLFFFSDLLSSSLLLSSLLFPSLTLTISAFPSVHIVVSLTSKLRPLYARCVNDFNCGVPTHGNFPFLQIFGPLNGLFRLQVAEISLRFHRYKARLELSYRGWLRP